MVLSMPLKNRLTPSQLDVLYGNTKKSKPTVRNYHWQFVTDSYANEEARDENQSEPSSCSSSSSSASSLDDRGIRRPNLVNRSRQRRGCFQATRASTLVDTRWAKADVCLETAYVLTESFNDRFRQDSIEYLLKQVQDCIYFEDPEQVAHKRGLRRTSTSLSGHRRSSCSESDRTSVTGGSSVEQKRGTKS